MAALSPSHYACAVAWVFDDMEESTSRERTKGKCGDLVELPNPTLPAEELASRMLEALSERGLSQTAVCGLLALSLSLRSKAWRRMLLQPPEL